MRPTFYALGRSKFPEEIRYSILCASDEEEFVSPVFPHSRNSKLIWLGEEDPEGRLLNPSIKRLAYQKEAELAQYRRNEMLDEAEVASLIEEAVYRTSKAANEKTLNNPTSYLFRTYTNLVDTQLRRAVKAFGMEAQILASLAFSKSDTEDVIVKNLTRQKVIDHMDERSRILWERHLLGYGLDELAAEEGISSDHLGKRLRRATEGALRRLLPKVLSDL